MTRPPADRPPATLVVGSLLAFAGVVAVLAGLSGGPLLPVGIAAFVAGVVLAGRGQRALSEDGRRWRYDDAGGWYDTDA